MTQRTFSIIKPDAVRKNDTAAILSEIGKAGFGIVAIKKESITKREAEGFYAVHRDKPFFPGLVAFITSSPLVAMAVEGPNAIGVIRSMVGATRPWEAAPGTIRGDLALEVAQNLIHASDGAETAEAELELWFPEGTLTYSREIDRWALAPGG